MTDSANDPGRTSDRPVEIADATPAEPVPGSGGKPVKRERPVLTAMARLLAFAVAIVADATQFVLFLLIGAVGSQIPVIAIDVLTGIILWRLLGFHWAFLPSFVVELLPIAELFPSWTLAVAFVVKTKKK